KIGGDGAQARIHIVRAGVEIERGGEILELTLEGLAVERAGALVEQVGGERGKPRLPGGIERRATAEARNKRHHRQAVILDQPSGDAAGAGDLLHLGRRGCRHRSEQQQRGGERGKLGTHAHEVGSGSSTPVTAISLLMTRRAALFTWSRVTAPMRSGQDSTSSRLRPVASAAPMMRAGPVRLSRAKTASCCMRRLARSTSCSVSPSFSTALIRASTPASRSAMATPLRGVA